ncbi:MAG: hypothetical protein EA001_02540 [Oscillatoriales cyanobacterium]|nr:MAG: hypothetical protein EA001_02540 [Oscillatoriales cyanobacterium]
MNQYGVPWYPISWCLIYWRLIYWSMPPRSGLDKVGLCIEPATRSDTCADQAPVQLSQTD